MELLQVYNDDDDDSDDNDSDDHSHNKEKEERKKEENLLLGVQEYQDKQLAGDDNSALAAYNMKETTSLSVDVESSYCGTQSRPSIIFTMKSSHCKIIAVSVLCNEIVLLIGNKRYMMTLPTSAGLQPIIPSSNGKHKQHPQQQQQQEQEQNRLLLWKFIEIY
jgi:hypothetical protein